MTLPDADSVMREVLKDFSLLTGDTLEVLEKLKEREGIALGELAFRTGHITAGQRDQALAEAFQRRAQALERDLLGKRLGPYEIIEVIGGGGMGLVFKGRQESPMFTRDVAVKTVITGESATGQERERFIREIKELARLEHPFIVPIYDSGVHDGIPYFVMQYVEGRTLDRLERDELGPVRCAEIVRDVARALAYLHEEGVVHRDVKPGNIMIDRSGHVKLLDFGIAEIAGEGKDGTAKPAGTPLYVAPEVLAPDGDFGPIDGRADIYALGAVFYRMLLGQDVFSGTTPDTLFHKTMYVPPAMPAVKDRRIPRRLKRICLRCLEKDVERRYPSAHDMVADLDRYLAAGGPLRVAVPAVAVVAVLAIGGVFAFKKPPPGPLDIQSLETYQAELGETRALLPDADLGRMKELIDGADGLKHREPSRDRTAEFARLLDQIRKGRIEFWAPVLDEEEKSARIAEERAKERLAQLYDSATVHLKAARDALDRAKDLRLNLDFIGSWRQLERAQEAFAEAADKAAEEERRARERKESADKEKRAESWQADATAKEKEARKVLEGLSFAGEQAQKLALEASKIQLAGDEAFNNGDWDAARASYEQAVRQWMEAIGAAEAHNAAELGRVRGELDRLRADVAQEGEKGLLEKNMSGHWTGIEEALRRAEGLLESEPGQADMDIKKAREDLEEARNELKTRIESVEEARRDAWSALEEARSANADRLNAKAVRDPYKRGVGAYARGRHSKKEGKLGEAIAAFGEAVGSFKSARQEAGDLLRNMVFIEEGEFFIDKMEVSVEVYDEFLKAEPSATGAPLRRPEGWDEQQRDRSFPVVGISHEGAKAYADRKGKELVTMGMWLRAAGYPEVSNVASGLDSKRINGKGRADGFPGLAPVHSMTEGQRSGCLHLLGNAVELVLGESGPAVIGGCYETGDPRRFVKEIPLERLSDGEKRFVGFRTAVRLLPREPLPVE